jgi:hypothetical protein
VRKAGRLPGRERPSSFPLPERRTCAVSSTRELMPSLLKAAPSALPPFVH